MTDHLYVMQSSLGHIKIGRSRNTESRRRTIEHYCGLPVTLLLELQGCGDREGDLHDELRRFRLKGEWFENAPACRLAIRAFTERDDIAFITGPAARHTKRTLAKRKVRHVLADGTLKVYSYPAYRITKADKRTNEIETC
jgi:hypothetical protein